MLPHPLRHPAGKAGRPIGAGLLLLCLLPTTVSGIAGNLTARFHPASGFASCLPPNPDGVLPLNLRQELPNGIVLTFQQTVLEGAQGYVCVTLYGKDPLFKLDGMSYPLTFTRKDSPRQEPLPVLVSGEARQSAIFCVFCFPNIQPGEVLLARVDRFGQSCQWEIPMPEEAEPQKKETHPEADGTAKPVAASPPLHPAGSALLPLFCASPPTGHPL